MAWESLEKIIVETGLSVKTQKACEAEKRLRFKNTVIY